MSRRALHPVVSHRACQVRGAPEVQRKQRSPPPLSVRRFERTNAETETVRISYKLLGVHERESLRSPCSVASLLLPGDKAETQKNKVRPYSAAQRDDSCLGSLAHRRGEALVGLTAKGRGATANSYHTTTAAADVTWPRSLRRPPPSPARGSSRPS